MNDIVDIWADDKLGRREDAELIRRFIIAQLDIREKIGKPRTFVLNLDSQWGGGKTFFLERFKQDLEREGHIVAFVNAWEDDHLDDPLIAVVAAIKESLSKHFSDNGNKEKIKPFVQKLNRVFVRTGIHWAKQKLKDQVGDDGFEELAEVLATKTLDAVGGEVLKSFEKQKESVKDFKIDLQQLTTTALEEGHRQAPLFVLIDELDRCRPDYAIKLLEGIKHLFSVENIVFVVATDTEQLSNAVSGAYGNDFDGKRYLKRFFDQGFYFADAPKIDFIEATFDELGMDTDVFSVPLDGSVVGFLEQLCSIPDVQLRDIKQMLERTQTFASIWPYPGIKINLAVLFPKIFQIHLNGYEKLDMLNTMHEIQVIDEISDWDSKEKTYLKSSRFETDIKSIRNKFNEYADDLLNGININEHLQREQFNPFETWVWEQMNDEYETRIEQGQLNPRYPASVLLEYPKLLQQLAKLDTLSRKEA